MLQNEVIIGTFQLTITPHLALNGARRGTLESVHVAPDLRGAGFGTKMMQYAMELAREKGAAVLQLTTNKARTSAKRFYEKLGFTATHEGMKMNLL